MSGRPLFFSLGRTSIFFWKASVFSMGNTRRWKNLESSCFLYNPFGAPISLPVLSSSDFFVKYRGSSCKGVKYIYFIWLLSTAPPKRAEELHNPPCWPRFSPKDCLGRGLELGLCLVSGWRGSTCKIEVDNRHPEGPSCVWDEPGSGGSVWERCKPFRHCLTTT